MRFLQTLQATLLVVHYAIATYIAPGISPARLYGRQADLFGTVDMPDGYKVHDIWGKSCDCKKECSKKGIFDEDDCTKCKQCPQLRKPNKAQDTCIRDQDEKERLFEKTKKEKAKIHVPKGPSLQEKMAKKKEEFNQRWKNRIARCLALTPLAIGLEDSEELDELWDEEWLDEGDYLDLWDSDLDPHDFVDNVDDSLYEDDSYIDEWVIHGIHEECWSDLLERYDETCTEKHKEILDSLLDKRHVVLPRLEKRIAPLVHAFTAAFRVTVMTGTRVAAVVGRAGGQVTRQAVRVVKGSNNKSGKAKMDGAKKMVKNHGDKWKNCLQGELPWKGIDIYGS